jgi:imidazole glycerol phosphate synthase subunit HisF
MPASFDLALLDLFPVPDVPLIVFGGLSEPEQLRHVLLSSRVSAAAIGNFLNYSEHAVQHYRQRLAGMPLRSAAYRSLGQS